MRFIPVLLLSLLFAACSGRKQQPIGDPPVSARSVPSDQRYGMLKISDPLDYSSEFLEALAADADDTIRLDGHWLTAGRAASHRFPEYPPLRITTAFFHTELGRTRKLLVERINQTTLNYRIETGDGHHLKPVQTGRADLRPDFYLRHPSASGPDGDIFPVHEYIHVFENCTTTIQIGRIDADQPLCARILGDCYPGNIGARDSLLLIQK